MTLLLLLLFLALSAFFSGSEIAFISANKLRLELQKEQNTMRSKILTSLYDSPRDFLSTMLVGNNIALVIFTYLMTDQLFHVLDARDWSSELFLFVSTLIITIIVLVFGEFLPKTFSRLYANKLLYSLAVPLIFFRKVLSIPAWTMTALSNLILRFVFKVSEEEVHQPFTQVDLENLLESNVGNDMEEEIDTNLFTNALQLKTIKIRSCMVPRTEVVSIDVNQSVEDLLQLFDSTKLSRIIVVDDDIENALGYVHHQQLLSKPKGLKSIVLDIHFVPESMHAEDMLNFFIQKKQNIACVVDEFGSISGIVTMEDILEEIFGEIEDEYDEMDAAELILDGSEWRVSGRAEIDFLNEKFEGLNLPSSDRYNTISGYLIEELGDIPKSAFDTVLGDYEFSIEEVSDTRIERVRIAKLREQ